MNHCVSSTDLCCQCVTHYDPQDGLSTCIFVGWSHIIAYAIRYGMVYYYSPPSPTTIRPSLERVNATFVMWSKWSDQQSNHYSFLLLSTQPFSIKPRLPFSLRTRDIITKAASLPCAVWTVPMWTYLGLKPWVAETNKKSGLDPESQPKFCRRHTLPESQASGVQPAKGVILSFYSMSIYHNRQ